MHSSLESLDLPALRTAWLAHASHPYGRDHIDTIAPAFSTPEAAARLRWTGAVLDLHRLGADLPSRALPDIRPPLSLAQRPGAWLEGRDLLDILDVLQAMREYRQALSGPDHPALLREAGDRLPPCQELLDSLQNSLDTEGRIQDHASPELTRIRRGMHHTRRDIRKTLQALLNRGDLADAWQESLVTLRGDRYVLPLRASHKTRVKGIIHDRSASGETLFIEPLDVLELNNLLTTQEQEERAELTRILQALTDAAGRAAPALLPALAEIGRLDAIRAGVLLARRYRGELPVLDDNPGFDLRGLRHPLLCLQLGCEQVVAADLRLGNTLCQLLVTGPNTGGKTVLLKAVGLAHLMAYLGLPIPAQGRCGGFDRILTVIGDEQSIAHNLSTFSAQLTRLRDAMAAADQRSLVILDELGSGTDPREGGALGTAIAEALLQRRSISLISTHLDALKRYALRHDGVQIASMRFDLDALRPTHQLQLGVCGDSHAIDIAQRLDLPAPLTRRARQLLQEDESQADRLVRERDRILQEAMQTQESAQALLAQAKTLQAQAAADADRAAAERERAYREARNAWQAALQDAKSAVHQRIQELKKGRDTAQAAHQLAAIDQAFQAGAPAHRHQASEHKPPRPGEVGIFQPFRLPATVLQVDAEHQRIQVSARGKQLWGRLDQFEPRPGMPLPREPAPTLRPAAEARTRLDLRGKRREEAEQDLLRYLDETYNHGLREASILHGTGNGVLADMVRQVLRGDPRVGRHGMARPELGGAGVTELEFK